MKKNIFLSITLFALTFSFGCVANNPGEGGKELASVFDGEVVQVFVEGRDRGFTPMTLRVRRNLGENAILLKKGKELVREFEIAPESSTNSSPERHAVFMDLERDVSVMGLKTFGIEDLSSQNDTLYYIPHYNTNLSINDVRYGLTLVITD